MTSCARGASKTASTIKPSLSSSATDGTLRAHRYRRIAHTIVQLSPSDLSDFIVVCKARHDGLADRRIPPRIHRANRSEKVLPPIHGQPVLEATLDLRRSCDHDVVFRRTV